MENMTKKILKMKSGKSVLLDTADEVRSFRALCYRHKRKPVSRKTLDNKFRVTVYHTSSNEVQQ